MEPTGHSFVSRLVLRNTELCPIGPQLTFIYIFTVFETCIMLQWGSCTFKFDEDFSMSVSEFIRDVHSRFGKASQGGASEIENPDFQAKKSPLEPQMTPRHFGVQQYSTCVLFIWCFRATCALL